MSENLTLQNVLQNRKPAEKFENIHLYQRTVLLKIIYI